MIKNFLHIIRWPNLVMLTGIQSLVYFRLLDHDHSLLTIPLFGVLSMITVLLGAGGYVINDYYDVEIDRINKPNQIIAGSQWPLQKVKSLYFVLLGIGGVLSIFLAFRLGLLYYVFIYPAAAVGLWYYSFSLKCKPILGNIWVSIFCAGVVGIIALPDIFLHRIQNIRIDLWFFMGFAFISTWFREVIKDLEDKEGDEKAGCGTFVVIFGYKAGKLLAIFLGVCLLASLIFWDTGQTNRWIKLGLNVLQGFTVASMAFVGWAKNKTYYHHASNVVKLVMALGTSLLFFS